MRANFENIELEIYGGSHSERIGMRLGGIPVGTELTLAPMRNLLERRAAKGESWSTARRETDEPMLKGLRKVGDKYIVENAQIEVYFVNNDVKSADYDKIRHIPRPSHADLAAWARDGEIPCGGGRFSGRMTAPLCAAGGIAKELLEKRGVRVTAYITDIAGVRFRRALDDGKGIAAPSERDVSDMQKRPLPVLDYEGAEADMERALNALNELRRNGDSAGGVIECVISGLKAGECGDAMFDGLEGKLAYAAYAIPAVKGVEFGAGHLLADMKGSAANDEIGLEDGKPAPMRNLSGGINGGICNGRPIIMRVAMRPTPSIAIAQKSVDIDAMKECVLEIEGRHDACIAPRAVPALEAAAALAIYDAFN